MQDVRIENKGQIYCALYGYINFDKIDLNRVRPLIYNISALVAKIFSKSPFTFGFSSLDNDFHHFHALFANRELSPLLTEYFTSILYLETKLENPP
ncbi:MAG: hypothetical protein JW737_04660, partial [Acidobacteria bacterium]|nr:hypothetical protein [Acidobacteriota bacterium]